ncbi:MAG TPA: phosphotransferase family protein [Terriglobales bacterium]|nr:phosphotransferase family protein [Terriglobales bacterium]
MTDQTIAAGLARFVAAKLPSAREVRVESVERAHGGASRETYRCELRWREDDAEVTRRWVVRRDPASSLIETERNIEFAAYASFQRSGVPVPAVLFLEHDPQWLQRPFFVMEWIDGAAANPFAADPYGTQREVLGEQFWRILGRIAAADAAATELAGKIELPLPQDCWLRELDRWQAVIDQDELEPQPIARAAIRWLRRHPPPPPARVTVVHGDYRSGNFLASPDGRIRAVLDWEMCHFGDPHEDLGWACDPLWGGMTGERPGQLIEKECGLELWQEESGIAVDRAALQWWEIFAQVKGLAIWISASKEYLTGASKDPVLLLSGWLCTERHNRLLSARMAEMIEPQR